MEILPQEPTAEGMELRVRGRLDAYWADHLARHLDELVRAGHHHLWLNMAEVSYLSSMGISLLLRFHKQLKELGGSFRVLHPSDPVKEVLDTVRLLPILVEETVKRPGSWVRRAPRRGKELERQGVAYEVFEYPENGPLACRTIGDPGLLAGCRFRDPDCEAVSLGAEAYALGIGALGRDFTECQSRFGEFLGVAGVAGYLPTDGTNVPDYLMLGKDAVANVRLCHGLVFEGQFAQLARFEAGTEKGTVELTELVEGCLERIPSEVVGMVLVAESAGLMGVSLRRSPALESPPEAPFAHPGIREWLSFTGERAYRSSTTLVVGVAARQAPAGLAAQLRPLGPGPTPVGHFHAAAFSHRTLSKGEIELPATVTALFESQHFQTILHLLGDYRPAVGLGESEFVRGACWAGPIQPVATERGSA